ncbi:hypothetical protein F4775DRAFT_545669 [Biscogniauxia sp. FL1348]|nr:hypothetical protein F4775DRAFT_545669 [Biscogniauxia sp. FL1348]
MPPLSLSLWAGVFFLHLQGVLEKGGGRVRVTRPKPIGGGLLIVFGSSLEVFSCLRRGYSSSLSYLARKKERSDTRVLMLVRSDLCSIV